MTSLFGDNALTHADAVKISIPYKKHTWLPVLTVLFLLSYGLMTMLIVEQGATIESQRVLIRELFRDSSELSAVKGKAVVDKNAADAKHRAQTPSANSQASAGQAAGQAANQDAANQATNAANQHRAPKKQQWTAPTRPAADLADDRRALITI